MDAPTLPGLAAPPEGTNTGGRGELAPRKGRPKGSTNKRSADLARYIEATYDGMTPGQQAAAIGMATRADLRAAKRLQRQARAEGETHPAFIPQLPPRPQAADADKTEAWRDRCEHLRAQGRREFLALPMLPIHIAALVVKAAVLAQALGIERQAAWALMAGERKELLPYVHQKLPIAIEGKGAPLAQVFVIPGGSAGAPVLDLGADDWSEAEPLAFPEQNQRPD